MTFLLMPSEPLCGPPPFLNSLLDDLQQIEQALRPVQRSAARLQETGCLEKIVDDESKLAISLNVNHFKPEELKVGLDGRVLRIEGKQEIKEKDGYSMRTFSRAWALPQNIDVEHIKSSLTEDGHLSIEAPKVTKKSITSKSIPIEKAPAKKNEKPTNEKAANKK